MKKKNQEPGGLRDQLWGGSRYEERPQEGEAFRREKGEKLNGEKVEG